MFSFRCHSPWRPEGLSLYLALPSGIHVASIDLGVKSLLRLTSRQHWNGGLTSACPKFAEHSPSSLPIRPCSPNIGRMCPRIGPSSLSNGRRRSTIGECRRESVEIDPRLANIAEQWSASCRSRPASRSIGQHRSRIGPHRPNGATSGRMPIFVSGPNPRRAPLLTWECGETPRTFPNLTRAGHWRRTNRVRPPSSFRKRRRHLSNASPYSTQSMAGARSAPPKRAVL